MNLKTINALVCLLLVGAQCSSGLKAGPDVQYKYSSTFKAGPEAISCAGDNPPPELQTRQPRRERIFFVVSPMSPPQKAKFQAFDVAAGTIEDIPLDISGENEVSRQLSPSGTYFVYRKETRSGRTWDNKHFAYQRPIVIRTIDFQAVITSSLEISAHDALTWSPDGNCLVIIYDQKAEIGLYHLANGRYESWQLSYGFDAIIDSRAFLSPDGRWLAGECGRETCITKANGEIVYRAPANTRFELHRWSPDSRYLVIGEKGGNLSYLDASSNWAKHPLIGAANCQRGCGDFAYLYISDWSPDGTMLAGQISRPGYRPLVVIEFPSGNYHLLDEELEYPIWSPNGEQMVVRNRSLGLYTVTADGQNPKQIKADEEGTEAYPRFWTRGE